MIVIKLKNGESLERENGEIIFGTSSLTVRNKGDREPEGLCTLVPYDSILHMEFQEQEAIFPQTEQ